MITYTKTVLEPDAGGRDVFYVEGQCVSSDQKPTDVANGSTLLEMDTSKVYMFDADSSTWREWG